MLPPPFEASTGANARMTSSVPHEVRVHVAMGLGEVPGQQRRGRADPRVVDEERHVARDPGSLGDGLVVEQVEPQHLDPWDLEELRLAGCGVDLADATLEELGHEVAADPSVGAGDQGGVL